mmetsp:Transcript_25549/g.75312  ORF Transcript_25549/g.75312 Transcript_25549/m.75312 type:complete len:194 (-) Transcript_25549:1011-1592(-)
MPLQPFQRLVDGIRQIPLIVVPPLRRDRIIVVRQIVPYAIQFRFQFVPRLDPFGLPPILRRVSFGVLHHSRYFLLGQTSVLGRDRNFLGVLRGQHDGRHLQHPVRIDAERHPHVDFPPGSARKIGHIEQSQQSIVVRHCTFPLVHVDRHGTLIVLQCMKIHGTFGRDGGAPGDQYRHYPPRGFGTEGEGGDVE